MSAWGTTPPVDPYEKNRDAAVAEVVKSGGCDDGTTAHTAVVTVTGCGSSWRVNTMCGEMAEGESCVAFVVTPDEGGDAQTLDAPADDDGADDALKLDIDTNLNIDPNSINVDKID